MKEKLCSFEDALYYLKLGKRVARIGWNGKGMWLVLAYATDTNYKEQSIEFNKRYDGVQSYLENFIVMKTVDNKLIPWLASQADILAEDWMIVE